MRQKRLFLLVLIFAALAYQYQKSTSYKTVSPNPVTTLTPNTGRSKVLPRTVQPCTARAIKTTLTTFVNAQGQTVRDALEVILEGRAKTFRLETASSVVDGSVTKGKVMIDLEHDEVAPYSLTIPGCGSERLEPLRNTMLL